MLFPPEVDEHAPEIARVLLDPVVLGLDIWFVEEAKDAFFELTRPFSGNDLDDARLGPLRLLDNTVQGPLDVVSPVVDVVEVKFELHRWTLSPDSVSGAGSPG